MNIQQKLILDLSIGLPKARHDDWIFFPNSAFQKINVISPKRIFLKVFLKNLIWELIRKILPP